MSYKKYVTIGVWIALLPFLGFPTTIKSILYVLTGLYLAYIGYKLYRIKEANEQKTMRQTKTFTEVVPPSGEQANVEIKEE